ncbi:hypothetical protein ECC02_011322 [Trypanosoma cruzi]|uniref:Uncharacterized protein n=1 Tax=Trypanosoma cruzi TaxID=5693 RepID=A0A7J6XQ50_TRYCR|nr:hypothetical protein ECC02_012789 [Trypanosoma cruzi]KAF5215349.1 hypothetical protein ECC02_011983 [Trypanosoma cruzi]KAF5215958.1 hypothetical protein ECC02_011322 [Trypanosoma cruzi]
MRRQLQLLSKNPSAHVPGTQNATPLTGRTLPKSHPQHIGNIRITGSRPPSSRDAAPWQHVSAATHARSYRSQQHLMCRAGRTQLSASCEISPHPRTSSPTRRSPQQQIRQKESPRHPQQEHRCRTHNTKKKKKSSAEASRHAHLHTHGIEPLPSYAWSSRNSNKGYKGTRNPCHPRSQKHKARNTPQLGHGTSEHRGRRR